MKPPPRPAKPDLSRDLDGDGDVDAGDDLTHDLNRDGRIDGEDRRIYDLDNDNDIDATDRRLRADASSVSEQETLDDKPAQSVGEALGLKKDNEEKWQHSHAQSQGQGLPSQRL